MEDLLRDLRVGLRGLFRTPAFTAIAVLTLALGVGATSSIFSIVNGTILHGLPWGDPETIVSFRLTKLQKGSEARGLTPAQYFDLREQTTSFQALVATSFDQAYLTERDEPYMAYAPRVSANALGAMRVQPLFGRGFEPGDGAPSAEPVVMLGERLWRDRYAADPAIVGKSVEVNGEPATVIGVISGAQWFPNPGTELLQVLKLDPRAPSRTDDRHGILGRLADGVSRAQAQAELDVVMRRLAEQHPRTDAGLQLELLESRTLILDDAGRRGTFLLLGAVGFVLLIVCGNLANLMLARGTARHKEIATRAALGASRGRLLLQLLTEAGAIALLALPLSLLVTRWCIDYFLSLVPDTITYMEHFFRYDLRVAAFAAGVSVLTVLLFGLSPALRASRVDLAESLKEGGARGGTDAGSQRLRSVLVVGQIALALSLLVVSSSFMQALSNVRRADAGFDTDGCISSTLLLPESRYATPPALRSFHARLHEALSALPLGARAGLTSSAPLDWDGPRRDFQIEGKRTAKDEEPPRAHWSAVDGAYFAALGLRVHKGRGFGAEDREGSLPVVVIDQALAEQHFPGEDPIGKRIELTDLEAMKVTGGSREIVGVVGNVTSFGGLRAPEARARIYEPLAQQPVQRVDIVLRSDGDPLALASVLRARIEGLDARLSLARTETMQTRLERELWTGIFFTRLMAILGGFALLLAAIGIYGVVSYSTARRTREFGIRAALGAEPGQIAGLVLRKTLALSLWGVAVGLVLSLLLARVIQSLLYDVNARSPGTLAAVSAVLLAVSLIASLVPVLRATRAQPMDALRVE